MCLFHFKILFISYTRVFFPCSSRDKYGFLHFGWKNNCAGPCKLSGTKPGITHSLSTLNLNSLDFPLNIPFIFYKRAYVVGGSLASSLSASFKVYFPPALEWGQQDIKQSSQAVGTCPPLERSLIYVFFCKMKEALMTENHIFYRGTYFLTNAAPTLKTGFVLIFISLAWLLRAPRCFIKLPAGCIFT